MKKLLQGMLLAIICALFCACENAMDICEYTWPNNNICNIIPKPESNAGKIGYDAEHMFMLDVYNTSRDEFKAYVDKCKNRGFIIKDITLDEYYSAENAGGYRLMIDYNCDTGVMSVNVYTLFDDSHKTNTVLTFLHNHQQHNNCRKEQGLYRNYIPRAKITSITKSNNK